VYRNRLRDTVVPGTWALPMLATRDRLRAPITQASLEPRRDASGDGRADAPRRRVGSREGRGEGTGTLPVQDGEGCLPYQLFHLTAGTVGVAEARALATLDQLARDSSTLLDL
jgi:hypothetical protein